MALPLPSSFRILVWRLRNKTQGSYSPSLPLIRDMSRQKPCVHPRCTSGKEFHRPYIKALLVHRNYPYPTDGRQYSMRLDNLPRNANPYSHTWFSPVALAIAARAFLISTQQSGSIPFASISPALLLTMALSASSRRGAVS